MKKSVGPRTLAFPVPVWVVGSYDAHGKPNMMTASWAGICCSKPPCLNVSLRKATYSYGALMERRAFTVSIPSVDQAAPADYAGKASGRDVDKFAATGLTATRSKVVDAPYVEEFPVVLECRILHDLEIGLHTLFVGEIMDVKADEEVLGDKGLPRIDAARPFVYAPESRSYFSLGERLGPAFKMGDTYR